MSTRASDSLSVVLLTVIGAIFDQIHDESWLLVVPNFSRKLHRKTLRFWTGTNQGAEYYAVPRADKKAAVL